MPPMLELFKRKYCLTDKSNCARYHIFKALGEDLIPEDLYPNEREKVEEILRCQCECSGISKDISEA